MKWSKSITIIRHGQSWYNVLKQEKENDPQYQEFKRAFEKDYLSLETVRLARLILKKYPAVGDYETLLTDQGKEQSFQTGKALAETENLPDVIFCSPYKRTIQTLEQIKKGWDDLKEVETIYDDRIREQEHGLANLYNDWRVFQTLHPEQKRLKDLQGPYWYQYPQGESVSQVRDRIRLMTSMLIREWAARHVWLLTHHLTILSMRANIERLTPEEFIRLDEEEKPVNCGITLYQCNPDLGKDGKLELLFYNKTLF